MTETPLAAAVRVNLPEYSVSEIAALLKRTIEQNFAYVRVRGEISGFKRHASGHCYFALKDKDAVLDAVCWRSTRLAIAPEDGMEVVCTGRLTTYPGRSRYQIVVDSMELAGIGALLKLLEERKARLAAAGLFAAERKRKLPFLPEVIGVVTSLSGAVIRDILHRLEDRFPRRVLIWPVAVQGDSAAAQVAAGIEGFNRLLPGGDPPRPDLLIVARGGGSLEDLMPFNEEIVVRAAAASAIPLVSAVGHETDTTLIDFAADKRAPTPTAAAEMAVPVRLDLMAELDGKSLRLRQAMLRELAATTTALRAAARGLPERRTLFEAATQRLDDRAERLVMALRQRVRLARQQFDALGRRLQPALLASELAHAARRLEDEAPRLAGAMARVLSQHELRLSSLAARLDGWYQAQQNLLDRGYVRVRSAAGAVLTRAAAVAPGAALTLEFYDGHVAVTASGKRAAREDKDLPVQGRLL